MATPLNSSTATSHRRSNPRLSPGAPADDRRSDRSTPMKMAIDVIEILIQAIILISLWTILYQVVKQQGRLLLRLDDLDRRLSHAGLGAGPEAGRTGWARRRDAGLAAPRARPRGADGIPGRLPRPAGLAGPLESRLRVLRAPRPGAGRLQADLRTNSVQLVLASLQDAESNRKLAKEHGLTCPIVLLTEDDPLVRETFQRPWARRSRTCWMSRGRWPSPSRWAATRSWLWLGGTVGKRAKRSRLPGERPAVPEPHRAERPQGGHPGPGVPFARPWTAGRWHLEDYRGRRVLLVFSDPHCGPCEELAPHLVRIHRQHRDEGLVVLMVTRGDVEENRRKADRLRLRVPGGGPGSLETYPRNSASSRCRWPSSSMRKGLS